jgi:phage/plasmid primase-like uncharacterized protein
MNSIEQFRAAMATAGIKYDGEIVADNKLHRFKINEDRNKNSWYVFHPSEPAAGVFGCWKRNVKETWCESSEDKLSSSEMSRVHRQWREAVTRERGVSDTTLWRWGRRGWIRLVNISGKNYVDLASLAEFDRRATAGEFSKSPAGAAGASSKARSDKEGANQP